ncbi:MAG: FGGY family carbohydrate kinase [Pseudomonadota bacterium]
MTDAALIGIDIGTSAVKAMVFDQAGSALASFSEAYPTQRPKPGHAEQDAETWTALVADGLRTLAAKQNLASVEAIGVTSQVNTHVFVDRQGNALAPAIVWQDGRCEAEAAELTERIPQEQRIAWWGEPRPIDASHCLARMFWMSRHHPDLWAKTWKVMLPRDYCIYRMTGEVATDPIANIGLVNTQLRYPADMLDYVPGAAERMVPLADMTDIAGRVKNGQPCAGKPVAVGTMDAWAGMFGTGVPGQGQAVYLSGTSEVLGIMSEKSVPTPGVLTFPTYRDMTLHAGPTQSGGAAFLWCSRLLNRSPEELVRMVEALDFDKPAPLFLPHLQGERAPLWDINARGTFLGMDTSTGPAELARAVFEGVACSAALLSERLEQCADQVCSDINCGGGGFRSDVWNQIRADILGKDLKRTAVKDPGVLGAAGLAAVAAGLQPDIEAAFSELVHFDRTYRPNPNRQERGQKLLALYKKAYEDARDCNHALVQLYA